MHSLYIYSKVYKNVGYSWEYPGITVGPPMGAGTHVEEGGRLLVVGGGENPVRVGKDPCGLSSGPVVGSRRGIWIFSILPL
jgi:hypothetical protein